jgi:predicted nucleic acid-binding protein
VVIVDTSAWIEFLRDGRPEVVAKVDRCLAQDQVGIGDLIYCELMQGVRSETEREGLARLLATLPRYDMVGFAMAERSAANYRLLRSKGVTVRKTIDVLIGTFCAENGFPLVHCDTDFDLMAPHIGLHVL